MDTIQTHNLPTIPHTLVGLVRAFEQPTVEFKQLAQIISRDPVIAAKVYQLGKSVFFNQWREVNQLQQLLVVLGIDTVRHLSLLCATEQFFAQYSSKIIENISIFWYRSVLCAHIAEELAEIIGYSPKNEAYLAGLLHRIGQLILISNNQDTYCSKIDIQQPLSTAEQIEKILYDTTSSDLGAAFIQQWEINPFIADAIRFQCKHTESLSDSTTLVRLMHLSSKLCEQSHADTTLISYEAALLFDLSTSTIEQAFICAQRKTHKIISVFDNANTSTATEALQTLKNCQKRYNEQLQIQVKNHALTNALQISFRHLATNREVFNRLRRDLYLLFGFKDLCFLLAGSEGNNLCGYDDQGSRPELYQVNVHFETSASLALQALQCGQILATPDQLQSKVFSIADQQIKNLMRAEALCFIPLSKGNNNVGVIAAKINNIQWQQLADKKKLLELAAQLSYQMLNDSINVNVEQQRRGEQEREEIKLHLRSAAHEINNPLSIINNYLHLLSEQVIDQEQQQRLSIIQDEITRVSTLVAGLKEITRDLGTHSKQVNINTLIQQIEQLFSPSLFKANNQHLILELDPDMEPIESCANNLKQILINLLKNASEALPCNGKVWITTRNKVYRNNSAFIEIEVRDNGSGIDTRLLGSLFKPVTSSKKNHSGLGLSIVKNLLEQIQGEISCSSSGTGTRFQILLPRILYKGSGKP